MALPSRPLTGQKGVIMKVLALPVGQLETNCYIVTNEDTLECVVIDPGDESNTILDYIEDNRLKCRAIMLTHGHFDHVGAANAVAEETGAPAVAMELPNGKLITGKTSSLLGASSACLLNALKCLGGIPEDVLLISPAIIEPIQHLKVEHMGNHNPRLHTDEVLIALSIYAMFPVLKNTYTGLLGVEKKYIEAAKGCGMSPMQSLFKVELPLALPSIMAGLRMAAIYTVSWAVLASMIGLGGLGDFVYQGTSSNNNTLILLGAVPAAVLAIGFGSLVDWLQKRITPRGMKKEVRR